MKSANTFFIVLLIFFSATCFAQTNSVTITNEDGKSTVFSFAELQSFPQTTLNVEGEDGAMHNYTGVDLYDLLGKAGVPFGIDVRRKTLSSYMLVKAADKYSIIYALAEVDTFLSNKKMILAYLKDNHPLPDNFGPLQIITTGEKKHARLIRQVTAIDIKKAE